MLSWPPPAGEDTMAPRLRLRSLTRGERRVLWAKLRDLAAVPRSVAQLVDRWSPKTAGLCGGAVFVLTKGRLGPPNTSLSIRDRQTLRQTSNWHGLADKRWRRRSIRAQSERRPRSRARLAAHGRQVGTPCGKHRWPRATANPSASSGSPPRAASSPGRL